jgi:hypothetical protein
MDSASLATELRARLNRESQQILLHEITFSLQGLFLQAKHDEL